MTASRERRCGATTPRSRVRCRSGQCNMTLLRGWACPHPRFLLCGTDASAAPAPDAGGGLVAGAGWLGQRGGYEQDRVSRAPPRGASPQAVSGSKPDGARRAYAQVSCAAPPGVLRAMPPPATPHAATLPVRDSPLSVCLQGGTLVSPPDGETVSCGGSTSHRGLSFGQWRPWRHRERRVPRAAGSNCSSGWSAGGPDWLVPSHPGWSWSESRRIG